MSHTSEAVSEYLNGLDRTTARPITVKIGRSTYVGAEYRQTRDHTPGTRAHADAVASGSPLTYELHALYLLGKLPPSHVNGSARAYVDSIDTRWFLSGWYPLEQDDRTNEYHPFGAMFSLSIDVPPFVTLHDACGKPYARDLTMPVQIDRSTNA
jgi:hypothetical protein